MYKTVYTDLAAKKLAAVLLRSFAGTLATFPAT